MPFLVAPHLEKRVAYEIRNLVFLGIDDFKLRKKNKTNSGECKMRKTNLIIALSLTLFTLSPAAATNWQVLYETDFSSDPCWTTNASDKMY